MNSDSHDGGALSTNTMSSRLKRFFHEAMFDKHSSSSNKDYAGDDDRRIKRAKRHHSVPSLSVSSTFLDDTSLDHSSRVSTSSSCSVDGREDEVGDSKRHNWFRRKSISSRESFNTFKAATSWQSSDCSDGM